MRYVLAEPQGLFIRFQHLQSRIGDLSYAFQNPGTEMSEGELFMWIQNADEVHNQFVQLITDAVREVHLGEKA